MSTLFKEILDKQMDMPTKYEIEKILYLRRNQADDNQALENSYYRTKKGMEGEELLLSFLKEYGEVHWKILQNVWTDFYSRAESDLILLTNTNYYTFEIKNYTGIFTYQEGICQLNGKKLANNCVSQAMRAHTSFQELCKEARMLPQPKGALAFLGEHNPVTIKEEIPEIDVIERNQIIFFIEKIKREERQSNRSINYDPLFHVLDKYMIQNPFLPEALTNKELKNIRKGIYCKKCSSFSVKLTHFYVRCSCGFIESREEAILRTICEYGVLTYNQNLKIGDLYRFFNKEVSYENLYRILRENFELIKGGRNSYYINKKLPYHQLDFSTNYKN